MPALQRPEPAEPLTPLASGELRVVGRMPWSSNLTFLAEVCVDGEPVRVVYKPVRGERPLWDFPPGLHDRELAAYLLSEVLGWGLVPETVVRDGPLGEGSVQRLVPVDYEEHYFTLLERPAFHQVLRTIAAFDVLANNADRKSGHCLLGAGDHVWAVDHGLCFHELPKLRTVIWDFAGEQVPEALVADVARVVSSGELAAAVAGVLVDGEVAALVDRAEALVADPAFPAPSTGHDYPWPLV